MEWAKSYARAERWSEEVILTVEEMRRVTQYLEWKSRWWIGRIEQCRNGSAEVKEGWSAYAKRQSAIITAMRARFLAQWVPELSGYQTTLELS